MALKKGRIGVLVVAGTPTDAERNCAIEVIRKVAGDATLTRVDLDAMVEPAMKRAMNPTNDVAAVAEGLDYPQREAFVRAAMSIALADGELSGEEDRLIKALAKAVGITDAHLAGIMATAPRMFSANPPALPS